MDREWYGAAAFALFGVPISRDRICVADHFDCIDRDLHRRVCQICRGKRTSLWEGPEKNKNDSDTMGTRVAGHLAPAIVVDERLTRQGEVAVVLCRHV